LWLEDDIESNESGGGSTIMVNQRDAELGSGVVNKEPYQGYHKDDPWGGEDEREDLSMEDAQPAKWQSDQIQIDVTRSKCLDPSEGHKNVLPN
jgi:hypothetical protein